jgi:hypothetical protein
MAGLFIVYSLFIFFSCKSLSPVDGQAEYLLIAASPETVLPQWRPLAVLGTTEGGLAGGFADGDDIVYCAGKVSRPRMRFNALRIDLSSPNLRIVTTGGAVTDNGKFLSIKVSSFVRDNGLLAGINALPFDPVSGREGEARTNIGVVITDGVIISPPHPGFDALVFYADGSAAIVSQSAILDIDSIRNAVGGFHRILEAGELVPRTLGIKARHPRSAAGISPDGRFLYLLVTDGRRPGSIGSTEAETALVLRALGAAEGINFDGGGSSALVLRYPDGKVRVANTPIHNHIPGRERAVAGCLGIQFEK